MNAPAYLIDASIYIFRAYFSLPERWFSPGGYPLNGVYGYTGFLLELLSQLPRPATVAASTARLSTSISPRRLYQRPCSAAASV